MTTENGKESFRLGFLTAIELPDRGFVGGLLVTNHFGRPLEFQCTAPVKPNRTQEILFGPTLVPYVLRDLIGKTLLEKVAVKPTMVLTERADLLDLRELVSVPVACVERLQECLDVAEGREPLQRSNSDAKTEESSDAIPSREQSSDVPDREHQSRSIRIGRQHLRFHSKHESDWEVVRKGAAAVPSDADLREPFERVREALNETNRTGATH